MEFVPRSVLRRATHYIDAPSTAIPVDLPGTIIDVSGVIFQGYSAQARIGDKIARSSVSFRYVIKSINTASSAVLQICRVALLWLHSEPPAGLATLTPSYFFGGLTQPAWVGPVNEENSHNFDIIYDESKALVAPQEILTVESPAAYSRNLYFDLKGFYSRYDGLFLPTQGYLLVLVTASAGGGALPFAEIDFNVRSKWKIKPL